MSSKSKNRPKSHHHQDDLVVFLSDPDLLVIKSAIRSATNECLRLLTRLASINKLTRLFKRKEPAPPSPTPDKSTSRGRRSTRLVFTQAKAIHTANDQQAGQGGKGDAEDLFA